MGRVVLKGLARTSSIWSLPLDPNTPHTAIASHAWTWSGVANKVCLGGAYWGTWYKGVDGSMGMVADVVSVEEALVQFVTHRRQSC